jgi:hypothetical protein
MRLGFGAPTESSSDAKRRSTAGAHARFPARAYSSVPDAGLVGPTLTCSFSAARWLSAQISACPVREGIDVARRMILVNGVNEVLLSEVEALNEAQLQERLKDSPDLLPVEELGLPGPLLVVGRETTLPSGAADLLALAPTGDLVVIEMKTGPQNSDFRAALAQATDYGADLWQMTFEVFEATVAVRHFASVHCGSAFRGLQSVAEAAKIAWPQMTDEDQATFRDRLTAVLAAGEFHFVIVAQRFTPSMMTTVGYLNKVAGGRARYFLVELVRFTGTDFMAFEARTILKPSPVAPKASAPSTSETSFLEQIDDPTYREAVERLFETCHGLELRFEWGARGPSIRTLTPYKTEPISLAWAFPPGVSGWMGLKDMTFGYDVTQANGAEGAHTALAQYELAISQLAGARNSQKKDLKSYSFQPATFMRQLDRIIEALATVVEQAAGR